MSSSGPALESATAEADPASNQSVITQPIGGNKFASPDIKRRLARDATSKSLYPFRSTFSTDPFEMGIPVAPRTGESTPVRATVDRERSEQVTRTIIRFPTVVTVWDQYGKEVKSASYYLSETIEDVKLSPEISTKESETGGSTLDRRMIDEHIIRPANGYKEFTDDVLYVRRQVLYVQSDDMFEPRRIGLFLYTSTIRGTVVLDYTGGCSKEQLGTKK